MRPAAPAPSTVPSEQAERHTATLRALRRLASRRPVVVILDDAQWGDDALAFVLRTAEGSLQVERHQGHGLVIVVGIADEAVAERPLTSTLVQRICAIDGVTTQSLLPLPPPPPSSVCRRLPHASASSCSSLASQAERPVRIIYKVGWGLGFRRCRQ